MEKDYYEIMRRLHEVRNRVNYLRGLKSVQEYIKLEEETQLLITELEEITQIEKIDNNQKVR